MKRILSAIALAVAAFTASAAPVPGTFTLTGYTSGLTVGGIVIDGPAVIGAGIGQLNATFDDGFGGPSSFSVYCIELLASAPSFGAGTAYDMNVNPALGSYSNPFTALQETRLQKLFGKQFVANGNTNADLVESAAMQLAVWEIVTETGSTLSLSNGTFSAFGDMYGAVTQANTMLTGLDSYSTGTQTFTFTSFNNGGNKSGLQDFLNVKVAAGLGCADCVTTPVPEPTTLSLAMAGLGVIGFGALRRRRA